MTGGHVLCLLALLLLYLHQQAPLTTFPCQHERSTSTPPAHPNIAHAALSWHHINPDNVDVIDVGAGSMSPQGPHVPKFYVIDFKS